MQGWSLRSRSSLPQNANTLSGSEAPSLHLFPPSNKCGSRSKNTTKPAPPSSTENASKHTHIPILSQINDNYSNNIYLPSRNCKCCPLVLRMRGFFCKRICALCCRRAAGKACIARASNILPCHQNELHLHLFCDRPMQGCRHSTQVQ